MLSLIQQPEGTYPGHREGGRKEGKDGPGLGLYFLSDGRGAGKGFEWKILKRD